MKLTQGHGGYSSPLAFPKPLYPSQDIVYRSNPLKDSQDR